LSFLFSSSSSLSRRRCSPPCPNSVSSSCKKVVLVIPRSRHTTSAFLPPS
jgi:hypothetical protein